jgi:hypothetical protein
MRSVLDVLIFVEDYGDEFLDILGASKDKLNLLLTIGVPPNLGCLPLIVDQCRESDKGTDDQLVNQKQVKLSAK